MKNLQFIAEIHKVETTESDGLKMVVYTNEMSPEALGLLMAAKGQQGMMLWKPQIDNYSDAEMKEIPEPPNKEFPATKSLSERLRSVLWVYHEKMGGKPESFETFRAKQMEKIIQTIKDKIPE